MDSLVVALLFGGGIALAGTGWSRTSSPDPVPTPLASAACLAGVLLISVNVGSVAGYSSGPVLAVAVGVLAGGWILRRGRRMKQEGPRLPAAPGSSLLGLAALALTGPLLLFPLPADTDAQGFGLLALAVRDGGTLDTLAPWHPQIAYLYSPGALILFAGVSEMAPRVPMSAVMMGVSFAAAWWFAVLAGEFTGEIGRQGAAGDSAPDGAERLARWRRAGWIGAVLSFGLWTALLDSHFPAVFGLLFTLGVFTSVFRFRRTGRPADAALAIVFAAGVAVVHPDMTIALALGYAALLGSGVVARDRFPLRRWLAVAAGPMAAAALVTPWVLRIAPLLASDLRSPFAVDLSNLRPLVLYQGILTPILAGIGAVLAVRRRSAWGLAMAGWWIATVDLGALGLTERLLPFLRNSLFRFDYAFSLAWHSPIVPMLALSACALVWLMEQQGLRLPARAPGWWIPGLAVVLGAGVVLKEPLLDVSRGYLRVQGSLSSANDVVAMRWIRDHAPPAARVLNYPGDYEAGRDWEAHWAPVLTERDCVYFRWQPFFFDQGRSGEAIEAVRDEQRDLLAVWRDPADPGQADLLHRAGIEYVLVPESVGDPASLQRAWRWAEPALLPGLRSNLSEAGYLQLVFSSGGAQVYRVVP